MSSGASFSGATLTTHDKSSCIFCVNPPIAHMSGKCTKNMSVEERRQIVYKRRACYNCLISGAHPLAHPVKECRNKHRCKTILPDGSHCKSMHHTLLCYKADKTRSNNPTASTAAPTVDQTSGYPTA